MTDYVKFLDDILRVGWLGTTRAEDAEGTPTQSQISPSIPVYEEKNATSGLQPRLNIA